jgi:hypothetical protein
MRDWAHVNRDGGPEDSAPVETPDDGHVGGDDAGAEWGAEDASPAATSNDAESAPGASDAPPGPDACGATGCVCNSGRSTAEACHEGSWSPRAKLAEANGYIAGSVAQFRSGATTVVWAQQDEDASIARLKARDRVDGEWQEPFDLSDGSRQALWPVLQVSNDGAHTVLWTEVSDLSGRGPSELLVSRRAPGTVWSRPQVLHQASAGRPEGARLEQGRSGDVLAVWAGRGATSAAFVAYYTRDAGWGAATALDVSSDAPVTDVSGALDSEGRALVVWHRFDAARNSELRYATYLPSSGWSTPSTVPVTAASKGSAPRVVSVGGEQLGVLWLADDGGTANLWFARFSIAGGFAEASAIEDETYSLTKPVGVAGDEQVVGGWSSPSGVLFAATGGTADWATEQLSPTASRSTELTLGIDPRGQVFALWIQDEGSYGRLVARRFVPRFGWGEQRSFSSTVAFEWYPAISVASDGSAAALWNRSSESTGPQELSVSLYE